MDRWHGMRCMGHSCNPLSCISMSTFFRSLESRDDFHEQMHKPAGVLSRSSILEHGTGYHHSVYAAVHGLEVEA